MHSWESGHWWQKSSWVTQHVQKEESTVQTENTEMGQGLRQFPRSATGLCQWPGTNWLQPEIGRRRLYNSAYKHEISSCPFFWGGVSVSYVSVCSLSILDTNSLASGRYPMYPLHSACLFSLLLMSFDNEKFLILMSSNLSILFFIFTHSQCLL